MIQFFFRGKFFGIYSKTISEGAHEFSRFSMEKSSKFLQEIIRDFNGTFRNSKKNLWISANIIRLNFYGKFFKISTGNGTCKLHYIYEKFSEVSIGCFEDMNREISRTSANLNWREKSLINGVTRRPLILTKSGSTKGKNSRGRPSYTCNKRRNIHICEGYDSHSA